jgi:hypothetical protein
METEEFEQIPWSQLIPESDDGRKRTLYVAAGVVVALVAGVVAARSFRASEPTVVDLPAQPAPAAEPDAAATAEPVPTAAPEPSAAPAVAGDPLSEADLMAVLPEEEGRVAAARAEWFVTDYFTVDGGAGAAERMAGIVPDALVGFLPHGAGATGLSYVEWARAFRVEPGGAAEYAVSVAYGSVASVAGGPIVRQPVAAVEVTVRFNDAGEPEVAGLPRPIPVPNSSGALVAVQAPPPEVTTQALAVATVHGTEPEAVAAYRTPRGWDVVVMVTHAASGVRWPLAIPVEG